MSAHATACRQGQSRAAERKASEVLTSTQIDAIILDCAVAGGGSDEIRAALSEARELASDGVVLDARGRVQWLYG